MKKRSKSSKWFVVHWTKIFNGDFDTMTLTSQTVAAESAEDAVETVKDEIRDSSVAMLDCTADVITEIFANSRTIEHSNFSAA